MSEAPEAKVRLACSRLDVERGRRRVLHGVDLELRAGEAVTLVGPNAAGKSTLVRALVGLLPATGEIRLCGRPLAAWSRMALARRLALVNPIGVGGEDLTVHEHAALGRYPHRGPFRALEASDRGAIARALDLAGIAALAGRRFGTLSAGERQLASLARGLAQEPQVLLLDEPAAHLDIAHQLALFRALDAVRAEGVAVLAVIHDLPRAASWAERMVVLAGGEVVAQGAPRDVLASPACADAFGVDILGHPVPGLDEPAYSFRERRNPDRAT